VPSAMAMEEPDFTAPDDDEVPAEAPPQAEAPPPQVVTISAGPSSRLAAAQGAADVGEADVAAAMAHGPSPQVVQPPGASGAAPAPEASKVPEPEEEHLPLETDSDAWLDLLRDGYHRQLREENEYPEPPPFHRAIHFAAEGSPCPAGKYPKIALNMQLQMLLKARTGGEMLISGKGGMMGRTVLPPGKGAAALAAVAPMLAKGGGLTQLLQQMQQGIRSGQSSGQLAQQSQLLIQAAKALQAAKAGAGVPVAPPSKGGGKSGPYYQNNKGDYGVQKGKFGK